MTYEKLFEMACLARENAYAPYSKYQVGACILTDTGKTFTGCNFENASFGATICAERCAAGCGKRRRYTDLHYTPLSAVCPMIVGKKPMKYNRFAAVLRGAVSALPLLSYPS